MLRRPYCSSGLALFLCLIVGLTIPLIAEPAAEPSVLPWAFGDSATFLSPALPEAVGSSSAVVQASAGCTASLDCGDGNTISCVGDRQCVSQHFAVPDYVECDGQRTTCPNACVATDVCACGGTIQCGSNTGDCQQGNDTVTCDGWTVTCPNFCLGGGF